MSSLNFGFPDVFGDPVGFRKVRDVKLTQST